MDKKVKKLIVLLVVAFGIFLVTTLALGFMTMRSAKKAIGSFKTQDLDATKAYLKATKNDVSRMNFTLKVFTPLRIIPFFGWYVADVQRMSSAALHGIDSAIVFTDAITPYADVLGLKGEGTFLGGTAQERLASAIEALSKIGSQIDDVAKDLEKAREQMDKVQSWRYPNILPGDPGKKVDFAKKSIDQAETLMTDTKPLLLVLPQIMGQDREKKYLVLFQNDKELRATGGFLTAYAVFRVNKGVVESEGSNDIYKLDDTLLKKIPAPEPIVKYLPNVSTLNLRDSNLSADYFESMQQFQELYEFTHDKKEIDGIIALDTQFVLKMMEVLGPIEVEDKKFTTDPVESCSCPQIIYELELYADQPVAFEKGGARKDIIGVLMQQMMDKTFNAPKTTWPDLLEQVMLSLDEKHLLLYFHDHQVQEAAERLNYAGRVNNYDGDYFYINETNFAGAKSNLYVQEKVKQVVKKDKGDRIAKKVTIEYKYPRKGDNCSLERKGGLCLAGIYRDWVRIYVPKGSEVVKTSGGDFRTTQDLDKTVFDTFFELRPEGAIKLEIEYTSPVKLDGDYKMLIQKQPGVEGHIYEIEAFGKKQKPFTLTTDKELIVKL